MKKKLLAAALALCMVFGSAAALPEGVFEASSTITASAEATSGNYTYEISDGKAIITSYNGKEKKVIPLEKPYEGLYVSNAMWREMFDFSPDAVLMVLASELYDESDYIRNYDEFLEFVKNCGDTVAAESEK